MLYTRPGYQIGRPHRIMCRACDRVCAGELKRLLVMAPPRHGKSEIFSRGLPAYYLGRNPSHNIMGLAYSADLGSRMNRDCQRIIDSPRYRDLFPHVRLPVSGSRSHGVRAIRNEELFEICDHMGSYRSAGVGGGIGGMGFHLGIFDDLIKNFEEASSQAIRDKVDEWFTSTFLTRQAPGAAIVGVMTRWHPDDIFGRLLERMEQEFGSEQWEIIRLPAIAEGTLHPEDDRQEGEALWPERFDLDFLGKQRASLGSRQFAGLYQQMPTAAGGAIFQSDWFRYFRDGGEVYLVGERGTIQKADCAIFAVCDPAASEKQWADYTVVGVFAATPWNDLLVLHIERERMGVNSIPTKCLQVCREWNCEWLLFENVGFQGAVAQACRRMDGMPPVRETKPGNSSKLVFATPAIIMAENGQIHLKHGAPWVKTYVDELCKFTGAEDKHDDQVDVTSTAARHFPRGTVEDNSDKPNLTRGRRATPWRDEESHAAQMGLWGRRE